MSKKISEMKPVSYALFLIGIVLLIEAASTIFVLLEVPQVSAGSAGAAWVYVLIKALISLYVIYVSFGLMKVK